MEKNVIKETTKKGEKFIGEFKTFIARGNVMDLAVGVLIGSAFQGLVTSFTDHIISPILGSFSKVDFTDFSLNIGTFHLEYGAFITDIINFIIMAFIIFMFVKLMNRLTHKEEEVKEAKVSEDIVLLTEIRDLLKNKE